MNPALTGCKIFDKRNQFSDMTQVLPTHTNTRQNKPEKKCFSFDPKFSTIDLFNA